MKDRKRIGFRSQQQGKAAETLVMNKLKRAGWVVIPTHASRSPIDVIAWHKKRKLWWGIQVKSSIKDINFDFDSISDICTDLRFTPVVAYVRVKKTRSCHFCMRRRRVFYHVFEDNDYHPLGDEWDCRNFKAIIKMTA